MAPRPVPAVSGDEAIRAAQDKLLSVERSMTVTGDPSAPVFGALAEFTGVLHQHGQDTAAILDGCREAIASLKQQVVTDEQVRQITFRMINSSDERVKQLVWTANLRSAAIGLVAFLAAGMLGARIVQYLTPEPELICGAHLDSTGEAICYRVVSLPAPPPPPAQPPQAEPSQPPSSSKPKGKN